MALETAGGQRHTDDIKCYLLELTPELRTYIFELTLITEDQIFNDFSRLFYSSDNDSYDQKIKSGQPPLTRINRQIRVETLPIYYSRNKFLVWVKNADGWVGCTEWLQAIGNSIELIRSLRIDVGERLLFVDVKVVPGGPKTHELCVAEEVKADPIFDSMCRPEHDSCICPYAERVRGFSARQPSGPITLQEFNDLGDLLWNEDDTEIGLLQEHLRSM
jgi:hypothetical protein